MGYGLWVMGYGLWVMGYGLWVMGNGSGAMIKSEIEIEEIEEYNLVYEQERNSYNYRNSDSFSCRWVLHDEPSGSSTG